MSAVDSLSAEDSTCDVCGAVAEVRVANSSIAAYDYAACIVCIAGDLEPFHVVVSAVWCCSGRENMTPEAVELCEDSLAAAGKDWGDVEARCAALDASCAEMVADEMRKEKAT